MRDQLYIGGNGWVYAIDGKTCQVIWAVDLNPGWFAGGNRFVSLRETEDYLYAFTNGRLHRIDKQTGKIKKRSDDFPKLRHHAGVFSTTTESSTSTDDDTSLVSMGEDTDGCGDGGSSGCDDGGGGDD